MEEKDKTMAVKAVEKLYKEIDLICHSVEIEYKTIYKDRKYVVPASCKYYFSYNIFGKDRIVIVERRNGNTKSLELNVEVAIVKDVKAILKETKENYFKNKIWSVKNV